MENAGKPGFYLSAVGLGDALPRRHAGVALVLDLAVVPVLGGGDLLSIRRTSAA